MRLKVVIEGIRGVAEREQKKSKGDHNMKNLIIVIFLILAAWMISPEIAWSKLQKIQVTSSSFENKGFISDVHACDILGLDKSPELSFSNAPDSTQSFALIMFDPDYKNFVHWVIFNIPKALGGLNESLPKDAVLENNIKQGTNGTNQVGYFGPCPPPKETHRYVFNVFALDTILDLESSTNERQLLKAMKGHIVGKGKLVGLYKNKTDF